jgi:hypothetical protein
MTAKDEETLLTFLLRLPEEDRCSIDADVSAS